MLTTRESFSLNADIRDAANNQKVMLHATYSTTSLSLNLDVLDAGGDGHPNPLRPLVAFEADFPRARTFVHVKAFLLEACKRAACVGLPCRTVAGND